MRELYKKFDSKKFDEVLAKLNKIDINQKVNEHNFCYAYDDAEYKELKKKELYERINCLICMYDTDDIDVSILLQSINYLYKNIDDYYIDPRYKKLFFFLYDFLNVSFFPLVFFFLLIIFSKFFCDIVSGFNPSGAFQYSILPVPSIRPNVFLITYPKQTSIISADTFCNPLLLILS